MATITLHSDTQTSATSVSNIFIDEYMSDANGEFVKIYLYLLRQLSAPDAAFSISAMADKFEHTEKDIKRALSYWERMDLLRLEYDANDNLVGVCFLDTRSRQTEADDTDPASEECPESDAFSEEYETSPVSSDLPLQKSYTAEDIKNFRQDENVAELLFISERYLGRILTVTDMNSILYWYDGLHFSTDLIEYLIEYCVSKGHTSIRYIDKVALAWADNQIETAEQAKQFSGIHSQLYFAVMKALGITGRSLVPSETAYIDKWKSELGFSAEVIASACERTIQAIHQPSFSYIDSILTNWKKHNVTTLDDVARLDKEHQQKKKTTSSPQPAPSPSRNKFNNFEQRSYDYDALEKMLLNTSAPSIPRA